MKGVLFSILSLFFNFIFCGGAPTTTPSPQEKEASKISMDLKVAGGNSIFLLKNWLINERVDRKCERKELIEEIGILKEKLKGHKDTKMKLLYIQGLNEVEDEFSKGYDDDYKMKKVEWDKKKLETKVSHDHVEEQRRQKWLHYAKNPSNDMMRKIVNTAKQTGIDEEKLAYGVAKAYRLMSENICEREGKPKMIENPLKFFHEESVLQSLAIVLKEADFIEDYLPKINSTPRDNYLLVL